MATLILMVLLYVAAPVIAAPLAHCVMSSGTADDCCQDQALAGCPAAGLCHGCNAAAMPTSDEVPVLHTTRPVYAEPLFKAMYRTASAPEPPPPRAEKSIVNP
jgi:hypothetical protein